MSAYFLRKPDPSDTARYVARYEVSFVKDTASHSTPITENTVLLVGRHSSAYRSEVSHTGDSIRSVIMPKVLNNAAAAAELMPQISRLPVAKFRNEVWQEAGQTFVHAVIITDRYRFLLTQPIQWTLVNETKHIGKLLCQKAIGNYGGRKWTAWYTQELPLTDGPYVFKGLPGLVVEVADDKNSYHFTLQSLRQQSVPIRLSLFPVISTTYDGYLKKRKEYLEDPAGLLKNKMTNAMRQVMTPEKLKSYEEKERRNNNFLE